MIKGVDLGWLTQLESQGVTWQDEQGVAREPLELIKEMGANAIRLRVFVNPPEDAFWQKKENERCMLGFCDVQSVVQMAKRVKDAGFFLMVDIHYSDHFADPEYQDIPQAWLAEDFEGMKRRVREHTQEVMTELRKQGIEPEWVQVGNEINNGILLPVGSFKEHPAQLVELLNIGYDAVKQVFPGAKVITHLSGLPIMDWLRPFLLNFFEQGGKTDILGFSYYPYWYQMFAPEHGQHDREVLQKALEEIRESYHKPVMIVETGGSDGEGEQTRDMLRDILWGLERLPNQAGKGVFYWEPEVSSSIVPDHYPLGACKVVEESRLQFNEALLAYKEA